MSTIRRLPITPLAFPTQLCLGLPLGIARPKRRRRKGAHPWLPTPKAAAA